MGAEGARDRRAGGVRRRPRHTRGRGRGAGGRVGLRQEHARPHRGRHPAAECGHDGVARQGRGRDERRRAQGLAASKWNYIHTHFGVGYRFAPKREGGAGANLELVEDSPIDVLDRPSPADRGPAARPLAGAQPRGAAFTGRSHPRHDSITRLLGRLISIRCDGAGRQATYPRSWRSDRSQIVPDEHLARADGRALMLSIRELRLLTELARRADRIVFPGGAVRARVGPRDACAGPLGGRLRAQAPGEARGRPAGLAVHPRALRLRLPVGSRAPTALQRDVHNSITPFDRAPSRLFRTRND